MTNLGRTLATLVTATTLTLGVGVATALTAAAVGSSACDWTWQWAQRAKTTTNVNLRTGPSTGYTAKGLLTKGTGFTEYCNRDFTWSYGKVTSGANAGKWGWVYSDYLRFT